eukprot:TRINITY_DN3877_c0_g2_i3.p1 TRINITY_DN3877_c0_g2~~TRINITY_DN3877_c0_g2_i3.p1  ORF type:complete len:358 (+),score=96.92 TRINITY_DN3877_c0_g2_i3:55-1128(+)
MERDSRKAQAKDKLAHPDSNLLISDTSDVANNIRRQMEFYFGDSNLSVDKFLGDLVARNPKGYVDLTIFLSFNKIKKFLASVSEQKERMRLLIEAIEQSSVLKLNREKTKVRRAIEFKKDSELENSINQRTIYVEDFPSNVTHEDLARIFSKVGTILNLSLPKFSDSKQPKGFAFIEYTKEEEAKAATEYFDNLVPEEFVENTEQYKGKIFPLRVIPKAEWLRYKEEFKKMKKELLKSADTYGREREAEKLLPGTLVRITGLGPNSTKQSIKLALANFYEPSYVDYKRGSNECIVRFSTPAVAEAFVVKSSLEEIRVDSSIVTVARVEADDERGYLDDVERKRRDCLLYTSPSPRDS